MPRFPSAFKGDRELFEDDYRLFNCQRCAKQARICGAVIAAISIAREIAPRTDAVNRFIGPVHATSKPFGAPNFMPRANTLGDSAKGKK